MTDNTEKETTPTSGKKDGATPKKSDPPIPKGLSWKINDDCSLVELVISDKYDKFNELVDIASKSGKEAGKVIVDTVKNHGIWNNPRNWEIVSSLAMRYVSFMPFQFKVQRLRDKKSNEEAILITCVETCKGQQDEATTKGEVITNLTDLQSDIKQFLRYGIALQDVEFFAIASEIKKEYMRISVKTAKFKSDKDDEDNKSDEDEDEKEMISDILSSLGEYILGGHIKDGKVELDKDLLHISPYNFNNLLKWIGIKSYQFNFIRKLLVKKGYIRRGESSISVTFRSKNNGVYRALDFYLEKMTDFCDIEKIKTKMNASTAQENTNLRNTTGVTSKK